MSGINGPDDSYLSSWSGINGPDDSYLSSWGWDLDGRRIWRVTKGGEFLRYLVTESPDAFDALYAFMEEQ